MPEAIVNGVHVFSSIEEEESELHLFSDIYDDLVERISSMAEGVTAMEEVNQWHSEVLKRSFGSGDSIITHYAVFLYVFGEQSAQSISVHQFYLQYLSVSLSLKPPCLIGIVPKHFFCRCLFKSIRNDVSTFEVFVGSSRAVPENFVYQ